MSAPSAMSKDRTEVELVLLILEWVEGSRYELEAPVSLPLERIAQLAKVLAPFVYEMQERR